MKAFRVLLIIVSVLSVAGYGALYYKQNYMTDTTPPAISFDSDSITVSVKDDEAALLRGVTATDNADGDITSRVMVRSISDFSSKRTAQVSYIVFDSSDNYRIANRTVSYSDYTPPKFILTRPLVYSPGTSVSIDNIISAHDALDGDITERIQLADSSITAGKEGQYSVTLQVTNSMGDTSVVELPVLIQRSTQQHPLVTLKNALIYLNVGDSFNPYDYILSVAAGYSPGTAIGRIPSKNDVTIESTVNTREPGNYYVKYRYKNENDFEYATVLAVIVEE